MRELRIPLPSALGTKSKDAFNQLHKFGAEYWADTLDHVYVKCQNCGFRDKLPLAKLHYACPNCYGDDLDVFAILAGYQSWGPQNGGLEERDKRVEAAKEKAKLVGLPIIENQRKKDNGA